MKTFPKARVIVRVVIFLVCLFACADNSYAAPGDTTYIDQNIQLIRKLKYEDPQHALRLNDTLLKMARALNNAKRIAVCYMSRGTIYDDLCEYEKAFSCYDTALAINLKNDFKKGVANVYNNQALIYGKVGQLEKALSSHLQSLRYRRELNDSPGIASSMGNIGLIYNKLKQNGKSVEYISESIRLKLILHETEDNLARWYNALAMSYDDDAQDSLALVYYTKAMKASEAADDKHNLGFVYGNMGTYYQEHQNYATSLNYMMKAYRILKQLDEPDALAFNTSSIGSLLNELGRPKEAIAFGKESLLVSDSIGSLECRSLAHRALGASYALSGNGTLANLHFQKAILLKDSMYNKNTAEATAAMEAQYKNEIKESEIKRLKQENEIRQLTINASAASLAKTRYVAALLILVIIGIAVAFYVTVERMKIKQQLRLALEREQLQKEGIAAVIQAQEEERKRIARDLHDNVCQQLGAIRMGLQQYNNGAPAALEMLDATTTEVRNIAYQMLPVTLQQYGLAPALEELVNHSFGKSPIEAVFENLGFNASVSEQVKLALYRVAQELLANVQKHSAATKVNIQLYATKSNLVLVVEDNGKGIDDVTEFKGMGLLNIRTRTLQAGGEITMEKSAETGLRTIVKIPLTI